MGSRGGKNRTLEELFAAAAFKSCPGMRRWQRERDRQQDRINGAGWNLVKRAQQCLYSEMYGTYRAAQRAITEF